MHALARLIRGVMDVEGLSFNDLARRAGDPSLNKRFAYLGSPSRPALAELPKPATISALSNALKRSQEEVLRAAAQDAGLAIGDIQGSELVRMLPSDAGSLSSDEVHVVALVVRTILDARSDSQ